MARAISACEAPSIIDIPAAFPDVLSASRNALVCAIASGRVDLKSMVTHRFKLDQIVAAYDLFANQREGVIKVAITP